MAVNPITLCGLHRLFKMDPTEWDQNEISHCNLVLNVTVGLYDSTHESAGRGEYEPRESNVTETGRALSKRVEIFFKSR